MKAPFIYIGSFYDEASFCTLNNRTYVNWYCYESSGLTVCFLMSCFFSTLFQSVKFPCLKINIPHPVMFIWPPFSMIVIWTRLTIYGWILKRERESMGACSHLQHDFVSVALLFSLAPLQESFAPPSTLTYFMLFFPLEY